MAGKFFEIAFSGDIQPGAELDSVRQKLGQMFKADEARLAQMFSGKRVFIKRRADEKTMIKFRAAFQKAGAICEIVALEAVSHAEPAAPKISDVSKNAQTEVAGSAEYVSKYAQSEAVPQALLTAPLGISGDQIEELATDLAPVGSLLLPEYAEPPEPQIDISAMDVAPVGSDLLQNREQSAPPPPNTDGLELLPE